MYLFSKFFLSFDKFIKLLVFDIFFNFISLLAILFLIADFRFQAFNPVRSAMKWPLFQSERFIIYIKDGQIFEDKNVK